MLILGLHINGAQSCAAVFKDTQIVFAVAEERINRQKQSKDFPINAIKECMEFLKIDSIDEFDDIAVSWNPAINMKNINMSGFTSWRRYDAEWSYIVPNNLLSLSQNVEDQMKLSWNHKGGKINFINHHISHLSQAYYQSQFNDCAIMISDEYSELPSITLASMNNGKLTIIKEINFPHSLGAFYAMITEFLGFRPNSDEWKVMGAAAYGQPTYYKKLKKLISWNEKKLELFLDLKYFNHFNMKEGTYISKLFTSFIGIQQNTNTNNIKQEYYDLAASTQKLFEHITFKILNSLQKKTDQKNIVVSGGSFMNSLLNGKILENTTFKNLFIPYSCADNGGAIGSALWVAHQNHKIKKMNILQNPYMGKEFSREFIKKNLDKYKINYTKSNNITRDTAKLIYEGNIVGWFQGRMEFGERALGNRSILADPRNLKMKALLNGSIKYRESFRPFAPAILKEFTSEYFDIPSNVEVPFMEQVYKIKKSKQSLVPAVVHEDGTGRLQMVDKKVNGKFHKLIKEFYILSNIPILINTSFNLNGEPIVYTVEDAIRTFYSSGLDILILGDYIIRKKIG